MPRLFTGLEIPKEVQQSLSLLRGGLRGARWIDPENYHITLRFIGDIDDRMAHEIASTIDGMRRRSFEVRFGGLTSFGGRKPRAIVVAVEPVQPLIELQAEQERLMQRLGLDPEGAQVTAHRTLARGAALFLQPRGRRISLDPRAGVRFRVPRFALRAVLVALLGRRRAVCDRGGLSAGGVVPQNLMVRNAAELRVSNHGPRRQRCCWPSFETLSISAFTRVCAALWLAPQG